MSKHAAAKPKALKGSGGAARLSFEQREGTAQLPSQLEPGEISRELRAYLWDIFYHSITRSVVRLMNGPQISTPWDAILREKYLFRDHKMIDEFSANAYSNLEELKRLFEHGTYDEVLGFVEWTLRTPFCPSGIGDSVAAALELARSAYRLCDGDTIGPLATEAEAQTIIQALDDASSHGFSGAKSHLKKAVQLVTAGDWADSIRESVHAVESVARKLAPKAATLDPALKELAKEQKIHPALQAGFGKLYGFASDEKGIRHPLIDDPVADIDEADAMYMLGACAAFVSYLIAKSKS